MTSTEPQIVLSTHWDGGAEQESGCLCYAAAEQAIQRGFGVAVEQLELAHNFMLSQSGGGASQAGSDYQLALGTLLSGGAITDGSWASVKPHLKDEMRNILEGHYGDMALSGRTHTMGAEPDGQTLINTITAGGLVAIGNSQHWKVVFGYSYSQTTYTLWVFDPWTGESEEFAWDTALSGVSTTFYVTG